VLQPGQRLRIVRVAGDVIEGVVVSATRTDLRVQLKFQQITINASDIADFSIVPGGPNAP
jgi:DNA-directed RNA polymerase subunit E'/Rpb7